MGGVRRSHALALGGGAALLLLLLARLPPPGPAAPPAAPPDAPSAPPAALGHTTALAPNPPSSPSSAPLANVTSPPRAPPARPAAPPAPAPAAPAPGRGAGHAGTGTHATAPKEKKPEQKDAPKAVHVVRTKDVYEAGHLWPHPELCPRLGAGVRLLVLVTSAPSHAAARAAVRLTWGHYAQRRDVALAFVLGRPPDNLMQPVAEEDALYGDIIMGASYDSYSNLTLKSLSMLEWAAAYCPRARRLLKTDDDMFINVPRLLAFMQHPTRANASMTIWGKVIKKGFPKRIPKSKYYLSRTQYPRAVFPDFATGPAYLVTADAVRPLLAAAPPEPYVRLEDVFVTGILADKVRVRRKHASEFYNKKVSPHPCAVQRGVAIHMVQYHEQFDLWRKLLDGKVPMPAVMEWCAAARMWRGACAALHVPEPEATWERVVKASPPDSIWHSLRNCVAYQAGVWQNLLARGITEPVQPAAFKLAIVLRHTPTEIAVKLLGEMFRGHPASLQQDLTSYILALMTDDEATWCGGSARPRAPRAERPARPARAAVSTDHERDTSSDSEDGSPRGPAPLRDLQLFGDCELAILSAGREEYDAHSKLVRAEYSRMTQGHYIELRVKVLNQFSQIPKLYHTEEFAFLEGSARENIDREINTLREHLLTGQGEHS